MGKCNKCTNNPVWINPDCPSHGSKAKPDTFNDGLKTAIEFLLGRTDDYYNLLNKNPDLKTSERHDLAIKSEILYETANRLRELLK